MAKTISGSKASLKLGGVKVAFIGSISINQENTLMEIEVLDQLEIAELAEVGHKVSFTCNLFKVDANSAKALGFDPDNLDDLLTQGDITMEVYDRIGDKVIYTMSGVKFEGGTGSIDARGVWSGVYNFKGKRGKGI